MKAYMYNAETGLYEGETFEESDMLVHEDGITTVPPPDYENGQVPVFNWGQQVWELLPVAIVRQLLVSKLTENRQLGFLGAPRVNVLAVNLALDGLVK